MRLGYGSGQGVRVVGLTNLLVEEVHVAVDLNGKRGEAMYRCEDWGNATPCSAAE
jgi:hypothetical protein